MDDYKRAPALEKKINEINPETDIRVTLVGTVVGKNNGSFVLDDGSDSSEIVTDDEKEVGEQVRVIARVLPLETGFELRAEFVQDANEMDLNLYNLVKGD